MERSADHAAKVSGIVDSIIYQNAENGYTVCEIEDESGEPIVIEGTIPYIAEGDKLTAFGNWRNHPIYGRQFRAEYYEKTLPADTDDILRYLSSGAIKGIGPKTAAKIVGKYGEDTFDILENHADWLSEIPGITAKKAADISESFRAMSGARSVMMFCRNFFSAEASMNIYKKWGSGAVERIREDPYKLCEAFGGISFKRADQIASFVGIGGDDPRRVASGIKYVLHNRASSGGHTCLERSFLVLAATDGLEVSGDMISGAVDELIAGGELISVSRGEKSYIYLPQFYRAEEYSAKRLAELQRLCPGVSYGDADRLIERAEISHGIKYEKTQREALLCAMDSGVMLLTGGPGTGKTTIVRALLSIFDSLGMECALAAPTGRASKRMSEATMCEAKTLHRLLEMEHNDSESPRFLRDEDNRLDEEVFIIDESSMIDVLLLEAFLRAVKSGSRIIFIGDSDQLPSVGAGNVLADLIASRVFPTIRLSEIFRQAQGSLIVTNAHRINRGELPDITRKDGDFFFLPRKSDREIGETVVSLCAERLPRSYGSDIRDKIQIITPSRKGVPGTNALNLRMQETLNPPSDGKTSCQRGDAVFREGDRVMQIKNNYSIEWQKDDKSGVGIFNGDIGVIERIDTREESVYCDFDGRKVKYDYTDLGELELAYAITVHKSQGCEYPFVVIPIYYCAPMLMTRNLLYTAITRASRMVVLVGSLDAMRKMIENDEHIGRYTGLCDMLRKLEGDRA